MTHEPGRQLIKTIRTPSGRHPATHGCRSDALGAVQGRAPGPPRAVTDRRCAADDGRRRDPARVLRPITGADREWSYRPPGTARSRPGPGAVHRDPGSAPMVTTRAQSGGVSGT
ncbi:hypothetical protein SHKM778_51730 [Streptomyces sp. KM77-8]|uniref:Uncharacterized protein n=1 Tax=Streptomyces haneummycinicus TaxID=3074435 RepID=A0AAT9HN72_9ACTN